MINGPGEECLEHSSKIGQLQSEASQNEASYACSIEEIARDRASVTKLRIYAELMDTAVKEAQDMCDKISQEMEEREEEQSERFYKKQAMLFEEMDKEYKRWETKMGDGINQIESDSGEDFFDSKKEAKEVK